LFDVSLLARRNAPWSISKAAVGEARLAQVGHRSVFKTSGALDVAACAERARGAEV